MTKEQLKTFKEKEPLCADFYKKVESKYGNSDLADLLTSQMLDIKNRIESLSKVSGITINISFNG